MIRIRTSHSIALHRYVTSTSLHSTHLHLASMCKPAEQQRVTLRQYRLTFIIRCRSLANGPSIVHPSPAIGPSIVHPSPAIGPSIVHPSHLKKASLHIMVNTTIGHTILIPYYYHSIFYVCLIGLQISVI